MNRQSEIGFIVHSKHREKINYLYLAAIIFGLSLFYPFLASHNHTGTPDFHATIEMVGALIGIIAGISIIAHFLVVGNRLHLLIGLAFFVNSSEDFIHGLLAFSIEHDFLNLSESSLSEYIPGTYVSGRILLATILLVAPFISNHTDRSTNPEREAIVASLTCLILSTVVTLIAFNIPLPSFVYPEQLISRPVDFISALILLGALIAFIYEYHQSRDMLTWWVTLSIAVNFVGQLMMSLSSELFDPFFDFAHTAKLLGYAIPLLGASLFTIGLLRKVKELAEKFEIIAHNDQLTNIPNRVLFYDRFQQEVKYSKRYKKPFSVLLIDLDKFKPINDTYGHLTGDMALKVFAQRISSCLRETDTVARLGGDEFAVILSGVEDTDITSDICKKIIATVGKPFEFDSHTLTLGLSIGVAIYPHDDSSFEGIMNKADKAMYAIKNTGRGGYLHYSDKWSDLVSMTSREIDEEHSHMLTSLNEISHKIHSDEFDPEETLQAIQRLLDDTTAHFANEESLFSMSGYPEATSHNQIHEKILKIIQAYVNKLSSWSGSKHEFAQTAFEIKELLINHVLKEDIKYIKYLGDT